MSTGSYTGFPSATAGTLIGATLAPNVINSSLTSVGTLVNGVWQATPVADAYISSAATWNSKQPALVSGTNIKTINGQTLLGSGNISFLEFGGQIDILYPVNGTRERLSYSTFPFYITRIYNLRVATGSLTLDVLIDGIAIPGLNNLAITTVPQNPIAVSGNLINTGSTVSFSISNAANPTGLLGTMACLRQV